MAVNIVNRMEILVARVAKVRRWLTAIVVLKVAAVCLLFACGYIGAYVWLDHRFNFGGLGRIIALLLLIVGAAIILYKLSRLLLVQISYINAANYIENKNSFDQQLVAAMEYYEKKTDYPYSEALAEYLVTRVCDDSQTFRFDSTVQKWHGYVLAAIVLFGFSIVGFYIHHNLTYLKTYFTRLTMPLAAIEPVSTTNLESTTGDFVAEPESMLTFTADIQGRVPENGKFVLEPLISDSNEIPSREEMSVSPVIREDGNPKLEASNFFEETGKFRYRFEAGPTSSEWHNIEIRESPKIESITAEVSLPAKLLDYNTLENYTEQIGDNKLELIENSTVTLSVQTTEKISEAAITGLDSLSSSKQLDGADTFTYTFTADKDGSVGFRLTDEKGLTNKNIPDLEIKLKTDEPPKFKLVSPESDYLATNVASIPIEFEVTDDFGLSSIQMCMELPDQKPTVIEIPIEPGEKERNVTHVLELEQHDLEVGDSILFYARATDITTGIIPEHNSSSSDTYFIEIRPYQQYWHLMPGGGESKSSGSVPEGLMTVLEYTRAIVKKTWAIANKQSLGLLAENQTTEDRSRLDSIADDLSYCSELLKTIRDDPENEFTDAHKAVLNQVLSRYEQALGNLNRQEASSALVPEKNAYRILRKFILELELQYNPPSSGQSPPQEKPDKVTLQESPEFTGFEKERIEEQMQKLQRNIEQLKREQKQLKTDFENFLEQKKEAKKKAQTESDKEPSKKESSEQKQQEDSDSGKSQDGGEQKSQSDTDTQSSGGSSGESQEADKSQSSSAGQGSSGQSDSQEKQSSSGKDGGADKESIARKEQSDSESDKSGDKESDSQKGQSDSDEKSGGDSEGSARSQKAQMNQADSASQSGTPAGSSSDSQTDGQSQGKAASSGKSTTASDNAEAGETTRDSGGDMGDSINENARLRMLQAKQRALQEKVSQLKKDLEKMPQSENMSTAKASGQAQKHLDEAIEKMEQFQDKMDEVRYDTQSDTRKATEAVELMDSAERDLASAENALEPGTAISDEQQLAKKAQEMAEQLSEDAEALDESLTAVEREEMLARLKAAERMLESMAGASWATIRKGRGQTGGGNVLTKDASRAADTAREISRQFWSIALNAQKHLEQPIEEKPSDARFYELENEFFENAAKYNQRSEQK